METISDGCEAHREIMLHCIERIRERDEWHAKFKTGRIYIAKNRRISEVSIALPGVPRIISFELARGLPLLGTVGCGKFIDPSWVDIHTLKNWPTHCSSKHSPDCHLSRMSSWLAPCRPQWFVDTWRMCLTPACDGARYVALSYVWGGIQPLRTVKANLEEIQRHQVFTSESTILRIPNTIKDAMHITRLLDERYLWVDSLCIVQDDDEEKHRQINGMPSIYANATITIIASQGRDANYGLRGLRGISAARHTNQHVFTLPSGHGAIERHWPGFYGSPWYERGWTFQEYLFSKRRLVFGDSRVWWECAGGTSVEDTQQASDMRGIASLYTDRRSEVQKLFSLPWPNMQIYAKVVHEYNLRQFTYPEDVLPAFAGITVSLTHIFKGGFLCGLPEMFFDIALLWEPLKPLKRRIPTGVYPRGITPVPSWSWAGWSGDIRSDSWAHRCDYIRMFQQLQSVIPIFEWYSIEDLTGERRTILSTWNKFKDCVSSEHQELPLDWTRHFIPSHQSHHYAEHPNTGTQNFFFKHALSLKTEFWYPIPMFGERLNDTESSTKTSTGLLYCRTQHARFIVDHELAGGIFLACYCLQDEQGSWAGVLMAHDNTPVQAQSCEFIAISRGYTRDGFGFAEWGLDERPKEGKWYEFYNVLWIRWEDGIAYREGTGRIVKCVWEGEPRESIDVILG